MFTLKGRTCVFSGGSGMVGRGAVRAMCEAGMNVVLMTHMVADSEALVQELKDCPGKCIAISGKTIEDPMKYVHDMFGSIDVVICNTGAFDSPVPLDEITGDDLNKKFNHQVVGSFNSVMNALPYLKESKAGRVILNASAGARNGFSAEYLCDSVARGGVITLTYCLARELMQYGITVNCIAKSGMLNDHEPHGRVLDMNNLKPLIPMGRIGTADEYGAAVAYLASEEAGFVTGQVIDLSGGLHIG